MKRMRPAILIVAVLLTGFASVVLPRYAAALSEQEELVERARLTMDSLRTFSEAKALRPYVKGAHALVIIPEFVKAGFILGGAHGNGIMIGRNLKTGAWRYPAFVALSEGSVGLQIGVDASEIVMVVMTEKGMQALLSDGVKLGGEAGIALFNIGAGREGSTTTAAGADVVTFARSLGLFVGLSVEGAVLSQDQAANTAYHGKSFSTHELVTTDVKGNRGADGLRKVLAGF